MNACNILSNNGVVMTRGWMLLSLLKGVFLATILISSTIPVWSGVPTKKTAHNSGSPNFSRPGGVLLKGTDTWPTPISAPNQFPYVTDDGPSASNSFHSVDSGQYTKILGVAYVTGHDIGAGICTHQQFKYNLDYNIYVEVVPTLGSFDHGVVASAAISFAKNSTPMLGSPLSAAVSTTDSSVTVTLGPVGIPLNISSVERTQTLLGSISSIELGSGAIPHPANANLFHNIEIETQAATKTGNGLFLSYCHATAYVIPHTLKTSEGQFTQKNPLTDPDHSIFFFTKA